MLVFWLLAVFFVMDQLITAVLLNYRYIPDASKAIFDVLKEMAQGREKRRRLYEGEEDEILKKVATSEITEATLREKLAQHVEQVKYPKFVFPTPVGMNVAKIHD